MPQNKDLKRVVRGRMAKTGEAYTTARAHVTRKADNSSPQPPAQIDSLAPISNASILARTGRGWADWTRELDNLEAWKLTHREIAALVGDRYAVDGWSSQAVTVGYERIKGMRAKGQRSDGAYEVNKSRTYNVPIEVLFGAWSEEGLRRLWLADVEATLRSSTAPRILRLQLSDGTRVVCWFTARAGDKSVVALQHEKLAGAEAAEQVKEAWTQRLDRLAEVLAKLPA